MICPRFAALALAVLSFTATSARASAHEYYLTRGEDRLSIGPAAPSAPTRYEGHQTLVRSGPPENRLYVATVRYARIADGTSTNATARFAAVISPTGEQRDERNEDPDYLTVLDQPFALVLDAATLRDLSHLHSEVPFDFASPIVGESLHGRLRRLTAGGIGARPSVGVGFTATGPIAGPLPGHPEMRLSGTITMVGEAYYDTGSALLSALESTLTISGRLGDGSGGRPVLIVYRRTIRSENAPPVAR